MKIRTYAMAGVAIVMLTAPAFAGRSTPAEREATRQLNLEAAQQAQNNNQSAAADLAANLPAGSPPAAAPTTPIQSASIASLDGTAPATLSSIQRPPIKIASANVLDAGGQTIGAVQRVEVTPDGMPTKVAVALLGKDEKLVVLDANGVKYDPAKNQILAQQSADQIRALPNAS
jgi:hypothetical protein